jgi:ERCC4-related helicase
MTVFTPGMRVLCRDAEWLVTRVESANHNSSEQVVYCIGADDMTRGHEAAFLTQLDKITPVDPAKTQLVRDTSPNYKTAKLFLEAQLRQMPLTDPEPHVEGMGAFKAMDYQKEAVQKAISQMRPRLLLADDVGLGKTVEVGMILSELMQRGQGDKILVLAKKSMLSQFQAELWNRFSIPLVRLDSAGLAKLQLKIPASKNPFEVYNRIIMSIDTLKDIGRYSHFLENTRWDCVVIDEAHNVAGATNPEKNLSYRLARRLSRRTNSMILTTATPHNGKRETFGRLISLLDPSAIPDPKLQEYTASDIKPFFMMRFKEDVQEEAGDNFSERHVIPISSTTAEVTSELEKQTYKQLADIRHQILDKKIKANAIVQWGMYKSYLSSPEACLSTATQRFKKLTDAPEKAAEETHLKNLITLLEQQQIKESTRFKLLLRELKSIGWDGKHKSPRVLIFTESRVTQEVLISALAEEYGIAYSAKQEDQAKQVLAVAHGGMSDVSLAETVESFGTGSSKLRLLLATDVASEGVNLHHECHNVIHYDLPWSIITLIQRNGRVDRFGQQHNPVIRYLMVESDEGLLKGDSEIFERLVGKVEEINKSARSGESQLKLYDAKKEEEYIAAALVEGNVDALETPANTDEETLALENLLQEATSDGHDDLMAMLMGEETTAEEQDIVSKEDNSRVRLMSHDQFLEQGYQTLKDTLEHENYLPLQNTGEQYILNPPRELRRRLGDPKLSDGVLFGATSIPAEAWPDDGQLRLTTSVDRVNTSIRAAMAQKGQWSEELLLTGQHPVMQWLSERLMMLMERGQAPIIASPWLDPGELLFCFIGQVSSRAGTPLIVDPHAVSFKKGGNFKVRPLKEALEEVHFEKLGNVNAQGDLNDALLKGFVASAVMESKSHLIRLKDARRKIILPKLEAEKKRLQDWLEEWGGGIKQELDKTSPESKKAVRLRHQLEEMKKYIEDREYNWEQSHYRAVDEPNTRLVLVVEGVKA